MKNRGICKGFTLAELLAVVIILSILTAIGAGTYKKAIERSRFNDGLNIATTVQEARDRFTYETDGTIATNKKQLDLAFDNMQDCPAPAGVNCIDLQYFRVEFNGNVTRAIRKTGLYEVRVYSEVYGNDTRKEPQCISTGTNGTEGRNFCISVGYGNCTTSGSFNICSMSNS